jgi:hypothetical protein
MTTTTKVSKFIKKSNPSDPDAQKWAGYAAALAEAILQRAFEMSSNELLAFVAGTEAGKRFADKGTERALTSAAVIAQRALLSSDDNTANNELTQADRDALGLVGQGVLEIRQRARAVATLGFNGDVDKIVAITDAMHNIPLVVGGFRSAGEKEGALKFDLAELKKALEVETSGTCQCAHKVSRAESPQRSAPVSNAGLLRIYGLDAAKLGAAYEQAKIMALLSDPDTIVIVNPSMSDADWSFVRELQESGHSVLLLAKVEHAPAETTWIGVASA